MYYMYYKINVSSQSSRYMLVFLNQYGRVHTRIFLISVAGLEVSEEAESQLQNDYLHQLTGVWSDRRLSVQKEFHILL